MTTGHSMPDRTDPGAALAYFNNSKRSGMLAGAGPVFWAIFSGAILISAIAIGTSVLVGDFRDRAIQASERELENTVQLLAHHFDRQLADFASIQNSVAARVGRLNSQEEFERLIATQQFHEFLREKINESADFAGVNVFDSKGDFLNSSERWPVPPVNLSDRNYFQAFKTSTGDKPLIELVESRVSKGRTIVIAKKVSGPNGDFFGMVTRSISPKAIEIFLSSVVLRDGTVAVHHQDGTLLARFPHAEGMIGQRSAFSTLIDAFSSGEATMQVISPVDGQERLASGRRLENYPLVVVATRTLSAALSDWRDETQSLVLTAGLAAVIICGMLIWIVKHLKEQHRRLNVAVNNMAQGLLLFDASERLVVCNKRYIEMFCLSSDIVRPGCKLRELVQHRANNGTFIGDVDAYCEGVRQVYATGKPDQAMSVTPDGRWMQITYKPLVEGGWVTTIEDVTEKRRAEERTVRLALYDTLTELPNRASFLEHLRRELDNCTATTRVAVLFLDTDEFKAVNDSLGHHVGDELLRSMARNLKSCLVQGEFVARLGGDEFAVVVSDVEFEDEIIALVQRVYEAIRDPHDCASHRLTIDSSIGIAFAPTDGTTCDEILQNADLAMYEAKSSGKRTYRFFRPEMERKAKERRLIEVELRKALDGGLIEVYYQPIIHLNGNHIVACEALARWNHAERGFVSPAEFIPVAEQSGLIEQFGEYVLRKACKEAVAWPAHIKLAVNVSPVQFKSGLFALKVVAALADSGLSARRLELEITEAVLIGDDEAALKVLHELKAIGVRVALDDFGTGYSSLSYLRRFPFDKIKIDRSFINGLTDGGGSSGIVRAVVAMASEHNMATTAEGVETEEQRKMLLQLKCGEMQGFLFSAARPSAEIRELLVYSQKPAVVRRHEYRALDLLRAEKQ